MSLILDSLVLWVHLFSAVIFVGGSFFMWIVVMPASHRFTSDESERTQIVGKMAKQFGRIINPTLVILVLSGLYNAWRYIASFSDLFDTYPGNLLLTKSMLVAILIALIYLHNTYFGRKIIRLAKEKKLDELKALRRRSRIVSFTNLGLMVLILLLASFMQTAQ